MRSRIEDGLESVHKPAPDSSRVRAHRDELEPDVMAEFERRIGTKPSHRVRRWAVGGLIGTGLAVAACQIPADYEYRLGHRLALEFPTQMLEETAANEIAAFVEENFELDQLAVQMRVQQEDGEAPRARMYLLMAGADVDEDEVWDELVLAFPDLEGARLEGEELETTVHGTVGGLLSHELLDVVIDRHGVEEARARILSELAAQGLDGDAEVSVTDDVDENGNHRREVEVRIRVEDDKPATDSP